MWSEKPYVQGKGRHPDHKNYIHNLSSPRLIFEEYMVHLEDSDDEEPEMLGG